MNTIFRNRDDLNITASRLQTVVGRQRYPWPMFDMNPMLLDPLGDIFCFSELPLAGRQMLLVCVVICADPLTTVFAVIIEPCVFIQETFQKTCSTSAMSSPARVHRRRGEGSGIGGGPGMFVQVRSPRAEVELVSTWGNKSREDLCRGQLTETWELRGKRTTRQRGLPGEGPREGALGGWFHYLRERCVERRQRTNLKGVKGKTWSQLGPHFSVIMEFKTLVVPQTLASTYIIIISTYHTRGGICTW